MIRFVSDFRQVGDFLRVLKVSSTNKTDRRDIKQTYLDCTLNLKTRHGVNYLIQQNYIHVK